MSTPGRDTREVLGVDVARPPHDLRRRLSERGDVLERAADLAGELGADVAVAPGVLRPVVVPKAEPIAQAAEAVTRTELKTQPQAARDPELEPLRDPERELTGKAVPAKTVVYSRTEWIAKRVYDAEQLLWRKTCSQCHAMTHRSESRAPGEPPWLTW